MDEPVRVKLYGLFPVTKRGYIFQLVLAGVLLVGLLFMWSYLDNRLAALPPNDQQPTVEHARSLARWMPWVIGLLTMLFGLEAYCVLRRFAHKEAALRAQTPQSSPQP